MIFVLFIFAYKIDAQILGVDTDTFCMGHISTASTINTMSALLTSNLVYTYTSACGTINNVVGSVLLADIAAAYAPNVTFNV